MQNNLYVLYCSVSRRKIDLFFTRGTWCCDAYFFSSFWSCVRSPPLPRREYEVGTCYIPPSRIFTRPPSYPNPCLPSLFLNRSSDRRSITCFFPERRVSARVWRRFHWLRTPTPGITSQGTAGRRPLSPTAWCTISR